MMKVPPNEIREQCPISSSINSIFSSENAGKRETCAVNLSEQAVCPSCRKDLRLRSPKLLSCLHSICGLCVQQIESSAFIQCPLCEQDSDISQIIDNLFIEEIKAQADSDGNAVTSQTVHCTNCDENAIAEWFCVNCSEWLCNECESAHSRVRLTKDHNVQAKSRAETSKNDRIQYCVLHAQEQLKLYCENCEVLTCRDCQLLHHKDHNYSFIEEAVVAKRYALKNISEKVAEKHSHVEHAKTLIMNRLKEIEEKQFQAKNDIKMFAAKLVNEVNRRGKQLMAELDDVCENKRKQLHSTLLKTASLCNNMKRSVEFVESAFNCENFALLYSHKLLSQQLLKLQKVRCDVFTSIQQLQLQFAYDASQFERSIMRLGMLLVDGYPHGSSAGCMPAPSCYSKIITAAAPHECHSVPSQIGLLPGYPTTSSISTSKTSGHCSRYRPQRCIDCLPGIISSQTGEHYLTPLPNDICKSRTFLAPTKVFQLTPNNIPLDGTPYCIARSSVGMNSFLPPPQKVSQAFACNDSEANDVMFGYYTPANSLLLNEGTRNINNQGRDRQEKASCTSPRQHSSPQASFTQNAVSEKIKPLSSFLIDSVDVNENSSGENSNNSSWNLQKNCCAVCRSDDRALIICCLCCRNYHTVCHIPVVSDYIINWKCASCTHFDELFVDPTKENSENSRKRRRQDYVNINYQKMCEFMLLEFLLSLPSKDAKELHFPKVNNPFNINILKEKTALLNIDCFESVQKFITDMKEVINENFTGSCTSTVFDTVLRNYQKRLFLMEAENLVDPLLMKKLKKLLD